MLLLSAMQAAQAEPAEVAHGRQRAIEYCSGCHQVTHQQPQPAAVPNPDEMVQVAAPSFAAISVKYKGHEKDLRAFIEAPLHPMKEQEFPDHDLDAIIAYIKATKKNW
ncbi:MAG: c-type cytochrome [Proteobacteria bacterium]|nr:c-type cytochrome [Pseudomonadota bacterium]